MAEQKDTLAELRRQVEVGWWDKATVLKLLHVVEAAEEFVDDFHGSLTWSANRERLAVALAALEGDEGRGGR